MLTCPHGHYEVWEQWHKAGGRAAIAGSEYEEWPRRRIVYDSESGRFVLYADAQILRDPVLIAAIRARFGLPLDKTAAKGDKSLSQHAPVQAGKIERVEGRLNRSSGGLLIMSALTDLLEKFNRKERFWLLRDLIGSPFLRISPEFRRKLADETHRAIPDQVWWAFDYHIDWLVAVLRTFPAQPELNKRHDNKASEIKGNQEDFDLIIAFDEEIILVEAKTGFFSNPELKSKLSRLKGIVGTDGITKSGVRISFVLSNPMLKKLEKLNEEQFFPPWALKNGKPLRIDLPIFTNALMVSRCKDELTKHNVPKKDAKGKYWAIYKS